MLYNQIPIATWFTPLFSTDRIFHFTFNLLQSTNWGHQIIFKLLENEQFYDFINNLSNLIELRLDLNWVSTALITFHRRQELYRPLLNNSGFFSSNNSTDLLRAQQHQQQYEPNQEQDPNPESNTSNNSP